MALINDFTRETTYLFQQLSVRYLALAEENAISFQNTFTTGSLVSNCYLPVLILASFLGPTALCSRAKIVPEQYYGANVYGKVICESSLGSSV